MRCPPAREVKKDSPGRDAFHHFLKFHPPGGRRSTVAHNISPLRGDAFHLASPKPGDGGRVRNSFPMPRPPACRGVAERRPIGPSCPPQPSASAEASSRRPTYMLAYQIPGAPASCRHPTAPPLLTERPHSSIALKIVAWIFLGY